MSSIKVYHPDNPLTQDQIQQVRDFLFDHLDQYGDARPAIEKAIQYAMGADHRPGGLVLVLEEEAQIIGAVVINKTGMSGYIPENILVYIATDGRRRGQGLGTRMMKAAIEESQGDIALHVEPENPARRLYERIGFTNKYLEMRLAKS